MGIYKIIMDRDRKKPVSKYLKTPFARPQNLQVSK
jgi:hypothetical protein